MICCYIDHISEGLSEKELAQKSIEYKDLQLLDPKSGVSLLTCHRIEYYFDNTVKNRLVETHLNNFKIIKGEEACFSRLKRIGLGLESKIKGENAIYFQVKSAIDKYSGDNKGYFNLLQDIKRAREKYQFYAPAHGTLIYNHIKNSDCKSLVLVGAGMLNQSIANSADLENHYEHVTMVTRDIKKAKRRLINRKKINLLKPMNLDERLFNEKFDLIIATDKIKKDYEKRLVRLGSKSECHTIVDVSSVPLNGLTSVSSRYYSLYSQNTELLIEIENQKNQKKQLEIEKYLKENSNLHG